MIQVGVSSRANAMFGFIQRKWHGDNKDVYRLNEAYNNIVIEIRTDHPSIWLLHSHLYLHAFVSYYPPLIAHFRKIDQQKVVIIDFEEILE